MESQEYPVKHFQAMAELARDLRTLPAQILEHAYYHSAFGSWWTTLQRKGIAFRIVFDGKEELVRRSNMPLERMVDFAARGSAPFRYGD